MKKSVYRVQTNNMDLEVLLELNREITDTDKNNIRNHVDDIILSLREEGLNFDPKVKEQSAKDKREIISLFSGREIFVEETKNDYVLEMYSKHYPWFIVTTSKGRIKIGWRKRVLNISWDESTIDRTAKELFPDEDVTKFDKTIHAWGYDKAKEYIDVLLK